MKILYIITQANGGGAQKYTLMLAKHFNGMLAAGTEDDRLFTFAQQSGIATFELKHLKREINPLHDFLAVWEIRRLINTLKPDIVHLNSSKAGVLGSFAAIGLKTKVVFTAHGFVFNEPLPFVLKSFYLALEKTASDFRDFIICVSEADKKSALENKIIKPGKIAVIHNGIEMINFLSRTDARMQLNLPAEKFIIGCIAGLYKTKGLDVLIKAVFMLAPDIQSRCEFILIGEGPEREHLASYILNNKLSATIKLVGNLEQAPLFLKAFDLFVLPSRKEGLPFTLLEAMQAALPIIATNVGGNHEALGETALIIEPENPNELAKAIIELVPDEQRRHTLSVKAAERSGLFTQNKMLEATQKIYAKLLKNPGN